MLEKFRQIEAGQTKPVKFEQENMATKISSMNIMDIVLIFVVN